MKSKIKESVLQELIELMEAKEAEGLKKHSPKFALKPEQQEQDEMQSVQVMAQDEDSLKEGLDKAKDVIEEMPNEPHDDEVKADENPEDLKRLLEMYQQLK